MATVLITGASGYVASNLILALGKKLQFMVLTGMLLYITILKWVLKAVNSGNMSISSPAMK